MEEDFNCWNYPSPSEKDVRDQIRGYRSKYGKYLTPSNFKLQKKVSANVDDEFKAVKTGGDDSFDSMTQQEIFEKFLNTIRAGKLNEDVDFDGEESGIDLENDSDASFFDDSASISSSVLNNSYGQVFGNGSSFSTSSQIFERKLGKTGGENVGEVFKPPASVFGCAKGTRKKVADEFAFKPPAIVKPRIRDVKRLTKSSPKSRKTIKAKAASPKTNTIKDFNVPVRLQRNRSNSNAAKAEKSSNMTTLGLCDKSKTIKREKSAISKLLNITDRYLKTAENLSQSMSDSEAETSLTKLLNDFKSNLGKINRTMSSNPKPINKRSTISKSKSCKKPKSYSEQPKNYCNPYFSEQPVYDNTKCKSLYTVSDLVKSTSQDYIQQIFSTISSQDFNESSIVLNDVFENLDDFIRNVRIKLPRETTVPEIVNVEIIVKNDAASHDATLTEALAKIAQIPHLKYEGNEAPAPTKTQVLLRISNVFAGLKRELEDGSKVAIRLARYNDWRNVVYEDNVLTCKKEPLILQIRPNRGKFRVVVYLLMKIYTLLMTGATCTKREIYYQILKYVDKQRKVNDAYDDACCLLQTPPWVLGIMPSCHGLVYGNLNLTINQTSINCNVKGGILIPQDVKDISRIETNAKFILIVEKDSIFQKILDEDKLASPFILITGKGYPDTNTRLFAKKLSVLLKLPMFILVDADPYGIEIMLTYRFGSLSTSFLSRELALPNLRWIGVHPSEIRFLNIANIPLSQSDVKKIDQLLKRPYMDHHPKIRLELNYLKKKNFKAEIEGLIKCNQSLSNFYIPNKLCTQDFV